MKRKQQLTKKSILSLLVAIFFCLSIPFSSMAQSGSYLDTIYQAVEGSDKAISSDYKAAEVTTNAQETPGEDEGTPIVFTEPNSSVTISDDPPETQQDGEQPNNQNEELSHVNEVFTNMTRILIGMNMGVNIDTSSFTLINLDGSSDTATPTNTNTDTGSSTSSDTGSSTDTGSSSSSSTDTDTDTGDNTDTGSSSSTDTNTGTDSGDDDDTDTGSDTGSSTSSDTDSDSDTDTGSSSETKTDTDTGSSTGSATDTDTDDDDDTDTDTGSSTGSDTGSNTGTNTGSQTSVDTDVDTGSSTGTNTNTGTSTSVSEETEDDLKARISSLYGIKCTDGDNAFTVRQLQMIDEVLSKLNKANSEEAKEFLHSTTEIIRESACPDDVQTQTVQDKNDVAAYVNNNETKIHLLDRATYLTQSEINLIQDNNPDILLTESRLKSKLEYSFAQTVAHEMTHCYQHSQAKKGNDVIAAWQEKFWQNENQIKTDGVPPSSYARTAPYEDMAESVGYYIMGGIITKDSKGNDIYKTRDGLFIYTMDVERYNYIKDNIFGGVEFSDSAPTNGGISI